MMRLGLGKGGRSLEETEELAAERAGCEIQLTLGLFSGPIVQKAFTGVWWLRLTPEPLVPMWPF